MKVYGPYLRPDGRKHVVLVSDGKKKTVSYPKYLMEQHLGRALESHETVDHINGDYTDNRIENLQILSRAENSAKQFTDHPELKAKYITLVCSFCGTSFQRSMRLQRQRIKNNKHPMFFCSKVCAGKMHN